MLLESLIGQRPGIRKRDVIKASVRRVLRKAGQRLRRPFSRPSAQKPAGGSALVQKLLWESFRGRIAEHPIKRIEELLPWNVAGKLAPALQQAA